MEAFGSFTLSSITHLIEIIIHQYICGFFSFTSQILDGMIRTNNVDPESKELLVKFDFQSFTSAQADEVDHSIGSSHFYDAKMNAPARTPSNLSASAARTGIQTEILRFFSYC